MTNYIGEISAFGTVICWVICSIAFERAGKRIGSMPLNLIRLVFAMVFISIYTYFTRGLVFPADATRETWFWLALSGVIGFFIGDLCLFKAFVTIGSRISLLIYSLAPPFSAFLSFLIFSETMSFYAILGMLVTIGAICIVVFKKESEKVSFSHPVKGVVLALIGTICQATGIVLSKLGMQLPNGTNYDPFASTQIRIISSMICFTLLILLTGRFSRIVESFKNKKAIGEIAIGSVFGPFIGVSLSLVAITYTSIGIASTITALLPVAIIFPHVIIYKEKVKAREIVGAVVSVLGVSLLFI